MKNVSKAVTSKQKQLVIIRDDQRIARWRRVSMFVGFGGMVVLVTGFILGLFFPAEQILLYQGLALLVGLPMSQVGLYFMNRYARTPRPDQRLDESLNKSVNGRLYHFILPAPHVLLTEQALFVFALKYQGGKIQVTGDKWTQKIFFLRKLFGTENVGNPSYEVEGLVKRLREYIERVQPAFAGKELPIQPVIVFTSNQNDLDLQRSRLPALHHSKVRGYLKQYVPSQPLSKEDVQVLEAVFDGATG